MDYLLAFTLLLTPAYALQFHILGLPTDVLMVWIGLVWLVFIILISVRRQWREFWRSIVTMPKPVLIFGSLFALAGLLSTILPGPDMRRLGQLIVLILEPLGTFLIAHYVFQQKPQAKNLFLATALWMVAISGIIAAIQYFTLMWLPAEFWGNSQEPKRALSFFIHPNFYALWVAPLLALLIPTIADFLKQKKLIPVLAWLVGAFGLLLSMSRAGWLGLGAAALVYIIFYANINLRKLAGAVVIVLALIVAAIPNLRWRIILPLYGEKSAVSRFSLWHTGWKAISKSPITGLGLTTFARQWPTLNTDPGLASASHNFPHNIFLDMWVELGLLGLISFTGLMAYALYIGLRKLKRPQIDTTLPDSLAGKDLVQAQAIDQKVLEAQPFRLALALFLIALIFAGLVDNPYFKNDLAMVFWLVYAFI